MFKCWPEKGESVCMCGGWGGIFTAFGFSKFVVVTGSERTARQGALLYSTFPWGTLTSIWSGPGPRAAQHFDCVTFKDEVMREHDTWTWNSLYFLMASYQAKVAFLCEDGSGILSLRSLIFWGLGPGTQHIVGTQNMLLGWSPEDWVWNLPCQDP